MGGPCYINRKPYREMDNFGHARMRIEEEDYISCEQYFQVRLCKRASKSLPAVCVFFHCAQAAKFEDAR